MSFAFERQAVINSCQPNLSEITVSNALFVLIAPTLASAWEASPPGSVLGELVFRKGGGKGPNLKKIKPSLEVKVAATIANANKTGAQLPLHYSLQAMTKKLPSLHPFSRNENGSVKIHGKVSRTANLQVVQDAKYRTLCKNRILNSTVHSQRYVKPVESNQVRCKFFLLFLSCKYYNNLPSSFEFKSCCMYSHFQFYNFEPNVFQVVQQSKSKSGNNKNNKHMSTDSNSTTKQGFGDAVHSFGKRLMESQQQQAAAYKTAISGRNGNKKARRFGPDEPVKSIIFQLYEDKTYWTTKDLRAASARSEVEIKKVLQEIATYHRSGEQKNTWELKKEYSGATSNNE